MRDDGAEKIGPHVDDRAHQQPAGRPALHRHALRVAIARRGQVLHAAMKSVNVLRFTSIFPASCHGLPRSPPPRMCAYAITTPRSSKLSRLELNPSGSEYPYEPYP